MTLAYSKWRTALDARLRKTGQTVVITRATGGGNSISCTFKGFVRTNIPADNVQGLTVTPPTPPQASDTRIILSGTELDAAGWPLTDGLPLPNRTDAIVVAGNKRFVALVTPILVDDVLARIEITVRG